MCFSFWHHIYDNKSSSPSSSNLVLTLIRGTAEEELLKIPESEKGGWENATVVIGNRPGGYKVSEKS